jgi:hypothetical protein
MQTSRPRAFPGLRISEPQPTQRAEGLLDDADDFILPSRRRTASRRAREVQEDADALARARAPVDAGLRERLTQRAEGLVDDAGDVILPPRRRTASRRVREVQEDADALARARAVADAGLRERRALTTARDEAALEANAFVGAARTAAELADAHAAALVQAEVKARAEIKLARAADNKAEYLERQATVAAALAHDSRTGRMQPELRDAVRANAEAAADAAANGRADADAGAARV